MFQRTRWMDNWDQRREVQFPLAGDGRCCKSTFCHLFKSPETVVVGREEVVVPNSLSRNVLVAIWVPTLRLVNLACSALFSRNACGCLIPRSRGRKSAIGMLRQHGGVGTGKHEFDDTKCGDSRGFWETFIKVPLWAGSGEGRDRLFLSGESQFSAKRYRRRSGECDDKGVAGSESSARPDSKFQKISPAISPAFLAVFGKSRPARDQMCPSPCEK